MHVCPVLAGGWAGLQTEPWISFRTCTWLLLRQEAGRFTGAHLLATLTPCARKYLLRNRCFVPSFNGSSNHPYIHPFIYSFFLFVHPSMDPSIHSFICSPIHLFIQSFVHCLDCYEADTDSWEQPGWGSLSLEKGHDFHPRLTMWV